MPDNNQLRVILEEQHVEKDQAAALVKAFGGPFEEVGEILADYKTIQVTDENDTETMALARSKRLALKKARTTVEGKRKELKADIVKQGRAIDGVARYVREVIEPAEEYLQLQEDFAKVAAEKRAAERHQARYEKLLTVTSNPNLYNFDALSDEEFEELHAGLKRAKEAEEAAAKKAEEDRKKAEAAERERQAKIEAENIRLRKEAEEREKQEAKIRDRINRITQLGLVWSDKDKDYHLKDGPGITAGGIRNHTDEEFNAFVSEVEKEVNKRAEAKRKADEAAESARQAELEKERKKAAQEREKRLAAEKAEADRIAAEQKKLADEREAERQALLAPDKQKLLSLASGIDAVRLTKLPGVKSTEAHAVITEVGEKLRYIVAYIQTEAEKM